MVDEWSGRPPQPNDFPRTDIDGIKALIGRLTGLATDLRESTSNLLRTAGIFITKTGMRIESSLRVEGDLEATGSTQIGGTLDVDATSVFDGDATFHGSVVIDGNLAVPNGSITNAQLASPLVIVGAAPATVGGWAVSTASEVKASSVISVPAGFSRATVVAWANMHFMDSSPNGGWLRATIAGNAGAEMGGLANLQLGQSASHAVSLTGLSGGTIGVSCDVRASAATGGMSGRIAQINAVAFFQR